MKGSQKMSKKTREHISIRLNPEKDADIISWYESLPHYERSGHVKDALNQYVRGSSKAAPLYRRANINFDSSSPADVCNTLYSTSTITEGSADEIQNNINEWGDLV
jgi:hypothetical protein